MTSKNERLQDYFDFDNEDIKENKEGRISQYQKEIVNEKLQKDNTRIFIGLAVVGVIVFVITQARSSSGASPSLMIPGMIGLVIVASIVLRTIKKSDLSLNLVEGEVNFVWEEHTHINPETQVVQHGLPVLKLKVDDRSFDVREELMDILDQGDTCRFYYTGGGDIVSAEFLGKS